MAFPFFSGSSSETYINVELFVDGLSVTYNSNECESRNFQEVAAGSVISIPLLPVCGDITIEAYIMGTPNVSCQYNGTQRNVKIEQDALFGCIFVIRLPIVQ